MPAVNGAEGGARRILFFGWRPWPNDHAVLETVYGRELPALGWKTSWVLPAADAAAGGFRGDWHGQPLRVARYRPVGLARHLGLLRDYLRLGREALKTERVDIVQARTGPLECLAASFLARSFGRPLAIQCSFPSTARRRVRAGGRGGSLASVRLEEAAQRRALSRAALILAVSDAMRDALRAEGYDRVVSFPLGADTSVDPSVVAPAELGGQTILYLGSLAPERDIPFVVRSFARAASVHPAARLALLGRVEDDSIAGEVERVGLSGRVDFLPAVPRADVPGFIRAARATISVIPPTETYVVSSPTKVLESLAMAIPVVANREIRDQREVIEASHGGVLVDYDEKSVAAALDRLLTGGGEQARGMGAAGRDWVVRHRSYRALAGQVAEEYERVVKGAAH